MMRGFFYAALAGEARRGTGKKKGRAESGETKNESFFDKIEHNFYFGLAGFKNVIGVWGKRLNIKAP